MPVPAFYLFKTEPLSLFFSFFSLLYVQGLMSQGPQGTLLLLPPIFLQECCDYSCVLQIYPLPSFWGFELRSSSFDDKHFYQLNHPPQCLLFYFR